MGIIFCADDKFARGICAPQNRITGNRPFQPLGSQPDLNWKDDMKNEGQFYLLCFSAVAVLLAVLLVFSGSMPSGLLTKRENTGTYAAEVTGDVSLRRGGSTYQLKKGMELLEGDSILVGRIAGCKITSEGVMRASLDRNSVFQIGSLSDTEKAFSVLEGAAFFDVEADRNVTLKAEDIAVNPEAGSALSVEAYPGTQNVNLYSGAAELRYEGDTYGLAPSEHCSVVQEKGERNLFITDISARELRDFLLQEIIERNGLCFETASLSSVLSTRSNPAVSADSLLTSDRMICTVEIRCDTVLEKSDIKSAKAPKDGTILPATEVRFSRGESVFDVLQRVCKSAEIPMDYTYTVMYEGFYVSEIAGFRELAYGPYSGWLYRVNGWFPNFGSSKYEVNEGDEIVWVYTCDGGKDSGRDDWMEYKPG